MPSSLKSYSSEKSSKELSKIPLEELYGEYEECQININSDIDKEINENIQKDIRFEIDNRDLDKVQLDKLYKRDYLSYPDYNNPNFVNDLYREKQNLI